MAVKYPISAQTGDTGVALVSQIASQSDSVIYRTIPGPDLGLDGYIELLTDEREPSGDLVFVQVKSGESYVSGDRFYIHSDRAHFETWGKYSDPVVGIVCNPTSNEARWVDISDYLHRTPNAIAGPYSIEAPANQPFSTEGMASFVSRFRRDTTPLTDVEALPNLLIREWSEADMIRTIALLYPISLDYPKFNEWLATKCRSVSTSKKVVEVEGTVAAFSMWEKKDERNIKLQTFMVAPSHRRTGIGQHLLYHEMRSWQALESVEHAYVTVSSTKTGLIKYFRSFGFRVEGFAPNRYERADRSAELVMGKHFVRQVVRTPDDLDRLKSLLTERIWGVSSGASRFGVTTDDLMVPAEISPVEVQLDRSESTSLERICVNAESGTKIIYDDRRLMEDFYPLRIHMKKKRYLIVPIRKCWADAMLSSCGEATALKIRVNNAYYCYPKDSKLTRGDLVVFYETKVGGGSGEAIGAAVVFDVEVDSAELVFRKFSGIGIYTLENVKMHTNTNGQVMGINFGMFEPFEARVSLENLRKILANNATMQGLTPIARDAFEQIRETGTS